MDKNKVDIEGLAKFLLTPQDSTKMPDDIFATTLTLSFIGMVARPSNIDTELLQKCCDAFNSNRGKTETEIEAVKEVIIKWRKDNETKISLSKR
jgi:dihydrodipicolinate synthase/N-acetylneuraminate lyase